MDLLSDGLHSAEPVALVAGFLLGMGVFQSFDGIVDHKLLRVHQTRYGADVTPYGWAWNLGGLCPLFIGWALAVRAARRARTERTA